MNRYTYAEGDPVNLIDPRGLFSCKPEVCGSGDDGGDGSDVGFRSQSTHPPQGNPSPPRPLLISNLEKSGKNYDQAKDTLNKIVDLIDPDCLSFLQSGGNDLKGYVSDLLSNNLLAVGSYAINYAAITNIGGTNLKPGDAAIVVNSIGAFFQSSFTLNSNKLQGGTSVADAFILLHELGHALDAKGFKNDGPSAANSRQAGIDNDNAIDQRCKQTLDGFR